MTKLYRYVFQPMIALGKKDIKKANKSAISTKEDEEKQKEKDKQKEKELIKEKELEEKSKEKAKEKERAKEKESEKEKEEELEPEPKKGKEKLKRKLDQSAGPPPKLGRPRKDRIDRLVSTPTVTPATPVFPVKEIEPRSLAEVTSVFFPALRIDKSLTVQQSSRSGFESPLLLEIENDLISGVHTLHQLRCKRDNQLVWEMVFSDRISAVCTNRYLVCATCDDETLSLVSLTGRRMCPKLALGSKAAVLKCNGGYVLTITTKALLSVWDATKLKSVLRNENLSHVIPDKLTKIDSCQISDRGVPIISLSNGRSYTYSLDLACWLLVADNADALQVCSDYHQFTPPGSEFKHKGFLSSIQAVRQNSGNIASKMFSSSHPLKKASTISHLESQIAASVAVNSREEYYYWLLTYVKYLVQEGQEEKLKEVCQDLLGPLFPSKSQVWEPKTMGRSKHDLLQEILPLIGSNLGLQRLFTEYSEQLESMLT